MVLGAILFAAIGLLTGILGSVPTLVSATLGAITWALTGALVDQQSIGQSALRVLILVVVLQATFLIGLALRTFARR